MHYLDTISVLCVLTGALLFLYRAFRPNKNERQGGCGCGTDKCEVAKPKLQPKLKPDLKADAAKEAKETDEG
jgi:hypothetical protein